MRIYHNSQDIEYRKPFGAAECGTHVQLRLRIEGEDKAECILRLWDGEEKLYPMEKDGEFYSAELTMPDDAGLLWYMFIVKTAEGEYFYCNNAESLGGEGRTLARPENSFQITVYKKRKTPEWFKEGIIYQIFPDSFARGADFEKRAAAHREKRTKLPHIIDMDWDDEPFYMKDEKGDITKWTFFGGTLLGIAEKLSYLKELGVSIIYLNPIFEAASSHRYDTADYMQLDIGLGDDESFGELIRRADELGMKIILDGVFSHVGRDSRYFDGYGSFGGNGAFNKPDSPYSDWFKKGEDGEYSYWWGVRDLPNADKESESYRSFIYKGEDSVVRHWLKKGIKGWRLDVADELPDSFIEGIRSAMDEEDEDSVLIGEVWEDASNKISYGGMRSYFSGDELNSTMNYPFRKAFTEYLTGKSDAKLLSRRMMSLAENYPPENFYSAMNLIGSHDRTRILSLLGAADEETPKLDCDKRSLAVKKLKLLFEAQMLFPGVPSIYYGDEAGLEGLNDPYNRAAFPWDKPDEEIYGALRFAADLRREYKLLRSGSFKCEAPEDNLYIQLREGESEAILFILNADEERSAEVDISKYIGNEDRLVELHTGKLFKERRFEIEALSSRIIYIKRNAQVFDWGKRSGVLCHITSLPGEFGCGSFGRESYEFIDYLAEKGYTLWQILPLNTVGKGDSPYYSPSVFAGNELLLDIEDIALRGYLTEAELSQAKKPANTDRIDFDSVRAVRTGLYKKAFARFKAVKGFEAAEYIDFVSKNTEWLSDYALFTALKKHFNGEAWQDWSPAARDRFGLEEYRKKLGDDIDYQLFLQYLFDLQLKKLRSYAKSKAVSIFGDLPIYVAEDSADVWANRLVFDLDSEGRKKDQAGVPPDYFAEDGQLWGNPLYAWEREECLSWWELRLKRAFDTLDFVRLDHFRGFEAYWAVPQAALTAKEGSWRKGPGIEFFKRMEKRFGKLPIIAEDLGLILPGVDALRNICGFLGMRVYQFSADYMFAEDGQDARVFYSGTHDNDTIVGWLTETGFCGDAKAECLAIIERLKNSDSRWAIFPLQDILCLGSEARMNIPGTVNGNWNWSLHTQL